MYLPDEWLEKARTTNIHLTGTGFSETGGTAEVKSKGSLQTKGVSVASAGLKIDAGGKVKDSGAASFASKATLTDNGSWTSTGAATFNDSAVPIGNGSVFKMASFTDESVGDTDSNMTDKDEGGKSSGASASFTKTSITVSGSWIDRRALGFDGTTVLVNKRGARSRRDHTPLAPAAR